MEQSRNHPEKMKMNRIRGRRYTTEQRNRSWGDNWI